MMYNDAAGRKMNIITNSNKNNIQSQFCGIAYGVGVPFFFFKQTL